MWGDTCTVYHVRGPHAHVNHRVQKVFFRKHTEQEARRLGLRGWCENTPHGTVQGQLEGPKEAIAAMRHWLTHTGSPKSHIDRTEFGEERELQGYSFAEFGIRR